MNETNRAKMCKAAKKDLKQTGTEIRSKLSAENCFCLAFCSENSMEILKCMEWENYIAWKNCAMQAAFVATRGGRAKNNERQLLEMQ